MCKVAAAAAALARSSSPKSMRVVSVLPSATEALAFIGGADLLVGRSHEDNFPSSITHLPILTGQKTTFTTAADVDKQVSEALSSGQSLYTLDEGLQKTTAEHFAAGNCKASNKTMWGAAAKVAPKKA